ARLHAHERRKEVAFEAERVRGAGGREERAPKSSGKGQGADRVIAVLVGDEDGADRLGADSPRRETLFDFFRRKTGVDEDARFTRRHDAGVSARAGGEYLDAHATKLGDTCGPGGG